MTLSLSSIYFPQGIYKHIVNSTLLHLSKAKAVTRHVNLKHCIPMSADLARFPFGFSRHPLGIQEKKLPLHLQKMSSIQPQLGIQTLKGLDDITTAKFRFNFTSLETEVHFLYL